MNDDDMKVFLEDFTKSDLQGKLDMWLYALDQEAIWEELLDEMAKTAQIQQIEEAKKKGIPVKMSREGDE